jgi:hypothetical protein
MDTTKYSFPNALDLTVVRKEGKEVILPTESKFNITDTNINSLGYETI